MNPDHPYYATLEAQFAKVVITVLWDNIGPLFLVNLSAVVVTALFVGAGLLLGLLPALLIGAFTAYPALVGLMSACASRMHSEAGSIWQKYWDGIRHNWLTAGLMGLALHGAVYTYLETTVAYVENRDSPAYILPWIALGFVILIFAMCAVYAFPLLALSRMGLRNAISNSLLMAIKTPLPAFAMLGLAAMLCMPVLWVGWGIMLITPIVVSLFWMANCDLQLYRLQLDK